MSTSDIIGLIGLMVGLQALLMVFYLKAIEKVVDKRKKSIRQVLRNRNQLENIHEIMLGSLSELSSIQRLYGALFVRLAAHTELPEFESISSEIGEYDFLLEKSMHEVNIFSSAMTRRQSAIRALAEEYGDIYSLELMDKSYREFRKGKDPDLKSGISLLKRRIQNQGNSGRSA